jgi:hypothetical protein
MTRETFDGIPGLFVYPGYFVEAESAALLGGALRMYARLEAQVRPASERLAKVAIPQPAFVRSAKHNLQSEEHYARLTLTEAEGREIHCEYFPRYGEDGHALCYCQGEANLPDFARASLSARVRRTVEEDGLALPGQALKWKLTMNFYKSVGGTVAGFPFHVDIPSNGVVTMILNIHREALFQIARGEVMRDIRMPVGCLLLLSGESRYEWMHRVLPRECESKDAGEEVQRVSLVLGYQ